MHRYLIVGLLLIISCTPPAAETRKEVQVEISKEVELMTAIQLISGYPLLVKTDTKLKTETREYFGPHKEEPVVGLFLEMASQMIDGRKRFGYFSFDKPIDLMMHYSLEEGKLTKPFLPVNASQAIYNEKRDTVDLFLRNYQDFYERSGFEKFFESQKALYDTMISKVRQGIGEYDLIGHVERFYGVQLNSYHVVLSPLQNDGGYSITLKNEDKLDLYAVVGAANVNAGVPEFNIDYLTRDLILHEFSHAFCNPIIDKYYSGLEDLEVHDEAFLHQMQSLGYGSWRVILYEYLVRASVICLVEEIFGKEAAEELTKEELSNGFEWMPTFLEQLRKYKEVRDQYPLLEDYFPEIVKSLQSLKK